MNKRQADYKKLKLQSSSCQAQVLLSSSDPNSVKLDKIPEYLRDTVDWFMGKTRRRDRENASEESKLYLQEPCLERKVHEDDLLSITEVPSGLDANEWHALHTIGFFEHINLLYGTISEFCTLTTCPEMTGPGPRVYMWLDDRGKKSKLSAPQYVDYVMTYVQKVVNDETMFPTKHGNEFPNNFEVVLKKVQKLLFHVVAHIYHSHFREIVLLGLHAHLNSIFAHIIEYNFFYHILDDKETEVLQDLVHALKLAPDRSSVNTTSGSEEITKEQSTAEEATANKSDDATKDSNEDIVVDDGENNNDGDAFKENEKEEAVTICDDSVDAVEVLAQATSEESTSHKSDENDKSS